MKKEEGSSRLEKGREKKVMLWNHAIDSGINLLSYNVMPQQLVIARYELKPPTSLWQTLKARETTFFKCDTKV